MSTTTVARRVYKTGTDPERFASLTEVGAASSHVPTIAEIQAWSDSVNHVGPIYYNATDTPGYPRLYEYRRIKGVLTQTKKFVRRVQKIAFTVAGVGNSYTSGGQFNVHQRGSTPTTFATIGSGVLKIASISPPRDSKIGNEFVGSVIKPAKNQIVRVEVEPFGPDTLTVDILRWAVTARRDFPSTQLGPFTVTYDDGETYTWGNLRRTKTRVYYPFSPPIIVDI